MIRAALMWLERWVFEEESFFIGFGKLGLIVAVVIGAIVTPLAILSSRQSEEAQRKCLEAGGAWAIIGHHAATTYVMSGKAVVPITSNVTDYGCVARQ